MTNTQSSTFWRSLRQLPHLWLKHQVKKFHSTAVPTVSRASPGPCADGGPSPYPVGKTEVKGISSATTHLVHRVQAVQTLLLKGLFIWVHQLMLTWSKCTPFVIGALLQHLPHSYHLAQCLDHKGSLMFLNELENHNVELAFCLLILTLGLCPTFQN